MKLYLIIIAVIAMLSIVPVYGLVCPEPTIPPGVVPTPTPTPAPEVQPVKVTVNQQQSQSQSQSATVEKGARVLDVGTVNESRLVYPGEVILYNVTEGSICKVRSAYAVGFYTIASEGGYGRMKVKTQDATPRYDPIFNEMHFQYVTAVDKINFWTAESTMVATGDAAYLVLDNRAPGNTYVYVEVTVDNPVPKEVDLSWTEIRKDAGVTIPDDAIITGVYNRRDRQ
jgi:hypothetical protein